MKITSSAFLPNKRIPKKYTGEGEDISPPLLLEAVPKNTASLVLIVDDPDAPMGTFDHWIAWNIKPSLKNLEEGASFSFEGKNHFGELGYRGPLPPPGPVHRYFFKLYALDVELSAAKGSTKKEIEEEMENHILAEATLIGTYQR